MKNSRDLNKKVLFMLLALSSMYAVGAGVPLAQAESVTRSDDFSWRYQRGSFEFADGLEFSLNNNYGAVVISDFNPGSSTASPSQIFTALGNLTFKGINGTDNSSVGAYIKATNIASHQQSLYGRGQNISLIGEYTQEASAAQKVEGLAMYGNGVYVPNSADASNAYAKFENTNTYLSALVNPTAATTGVFRALSAEQGSEAIFDGNAYLNLQMNANAMSGGEVLYSSVSHVEFNGDHTELTGTSASGQRYTDIVGAKLRGNVIDNVMQTRTNQLLFNGKEVVIDVAGAGASNVLGIDAQAGYVEVTNTVETFGVTAKAEGNNSDRDVIGIQALIHASIDIQAQATTITTRTDAPIGSFHNTALYATGNGHINIQGGMVNISTFGPNNGGVTLYAYGLGGNSITLADGVTGNVGTDITINADDITITSSTTGTGEAIAAYAYAYDDDATIHVNSDATGADQGKTVNVTGKIYASSNERDRGGKAYFNFSNADSQFTGKTQYWPGEGDGSEINLGVTNGALWNLTGDSWVTRLNFSNALIDMRADNNTYSDLTVANMQGSGGVIQQDINVRTMESDKVLVTGNYSGSQALDIYQKDNYVPFGEDAEGNGLVLASVNGDGTFTALDREGTLFRTHYDLASQDSATAGYTTDWYLRAIEVNNQTASVNAIMSSGALNYLTWRNDNDKLLQRLGELRQNGEQEQGAWFNIKGSKLGRNGKYGFENKYNTYELGYDEVTERTAEHTRYFGAAVSYNDGNSSYSRGNGDNSSKAISLYSTDIGSKGHYLDLVLKLSSLANDFTVFDSRNNKITGDFDNTGLAFSAEYGRKNALNNGWYIEPQAQLTLGYLRGDSYVTDNGINVNQSGIKSAVARMGFNIGKEIGQNGIVYAKANLLHEFGGNYDVTMTDDSGSIKVDDNFNETWLEYGLGAAFATGKNNNLYFDVERSTGSDLKKDWQWNLGARWTF